MRGLVNLVIELTSEDIVWLLLRNNRLFVNPGQLVEVEVNFIAEQVQFMIQEADTEEE